uniref:Arylsulfatase B-like n=1 Tax=Saccoglossus kowalevskii TaxID=10224 RepID=A0ABM0GSQ6_SACKO|nr:PREDICTED: arylsulfatase B-like [Saccoglossus kowalevskii]
MDLTPLFRAVCFLILIRITEGGDKRPNIVFILADDFGWHDIGYHGSIVRSPYMDFLASEGVKLENYYVQPMCSPTRAQLMSGRYQIRYGLQHLVIQPDQRACLPPDEVTIAQKMKEAGYATHMVGKWHLGFYRKECLPINRGFDTFFGFLNCLIYHYTYDFGYWHTPESGNKTIMFGWDLFRNHDCVAKEHKGEYSTILFAEEAQRVIWNHDQETPMFLYLPFAAVHNPLDVPREYEAMYEGIIEDEQRRKKAAMVTCMDEAIWNITKALMDTGMWDNTVLIFSTDNGGATSVGGNNWPLRGGKRSMFEGGIRGVGFVTSPLLDEAVRGTENNQLIHVTDWFPTFVHLAEGNLSGTKPLDGFNQWDTISQGMFSPRNEFLINIDPMEICANPLATNQFRPNPYFDVCVRGGIRVGKWKLVTGVPRQMYWTAPPELGLENIRLSEGKDKMVWLFDVYEDPNELYDMSEEKPDIVMALLQKLGNYNATAVPVNYPAGDMWANPQLRKGHAWGPWV